MCRCFPIAVLLTCTLLASVGYGDSPTIIPTETSKKATAALQPLLEKSKDAKADRGQLRLDLLALQRAYPGTSAARQAALLVTKLPSPLEQLDPAKIDPGERFDQQPKELVAVLLGHTRAVAALAFAPDGITLASSSLDGTVRLWKLDGPAPREWATLKASGSGVAFAPDGKTLATGRHDTLVRMWDITGKEPKVGVTLPGHQHRPFVLLFAPNGKLFLSGCYNPVMRLWDLRESEPEAWAVVVDDNASAVVSSAAISADGGRLAAGSPIPGRPLRLWDISGKYMEALDIPKIHARLVAMSPDARTLAFTGDEATVQLWDVSLKQPKVGLTLAGHPLKGETATVRALAFSPDQMLLATAGKDRRIIVWQATTGKQVHTWTLPEEVHALAFAADGRHLAAAGSGGGVFVLRCGNK